MKTKYLFFLFLNSLFFTTVLHADPVEDAFKYVYKVGAWGRDHEGQGTSGGGSTIHNTEVYRPFLQKFLLDNQIKSVIDFGCGDWQFSQLIDWDGINYLGIDVVDHLIEKNQREFGSSTINFMHGNGVLLDLPEADLLICKDVLQHLTIQNIHLFLTQLSKYKYCLITNDVDPNTLTSSNHDVANGGYRFIDLTQPPFNILGIKILTYKTKDETKQVLLIQN